MHLSHHCCWLCPDFMLVWCVADGKGVPMGEDEEAEMERMAHRRRQAAVSEAWRRSAPLSLCCNLL